MRNTGQERNYNDFVESKKVGNFESVLIEIDEARNNNEIADFLASKDLRFHSKHEEKLTANYIFKKGQLP